MNDPVDDRLLDAPYDAGTYTAIKLRADLRRKDLGRRKPSQVEVDREWLIQYTDILRARLLYLTSKT